MAYKFLYWALLTPLWDPLSGIGGVQGGRDYEGGRCVALILPL